MSPRFPSPVIDQMSIGSAGTVWGKGYDRARASFLYRPRILVPIRREDEVFATMAQQIVGLMPAVVRALAG